MDKPFLEMTNDEKIKYVLNHPEFKEQATKNIEIVAVKCAVIGVVFGVMFGAAFMYAFNKNWNKHYLR